MKEYLPIPPVSATLHPLYTWLSPAVSIEIVIVMKRECSEPVATTEFMTLLSMASWLSAGLALDLNICVRKFVAPEYSYVFPVMVGDSDNIHLFGLPLWKSFGQSAAEFGPASPPILSRWYDSDTNVTTSDRAIAISESNNKNDFILELKEKRVVLYTRKKII